MEEFMSIKWIEKPITAKETKVADDRFFFPCGCLVAKKVVCGIYQDNK
jgi:hypothetical protein